MGDEYGYTFRYASDEGHSEAAAGVTFTPNPAAESAPPSYADAIAMAGGAQFHVDVPEDYTTVHAGADKPPEPSAPSQAMVMGTSTVSLASVASDAGFVGAQPQMLPPPTQPVPVTVKYEDTSDGITSDDAALNTNPDLLKAFFLQHNTAPRLGVKVWGHHQERRTRTEHYTDSKGHSHTRTTTHYVTVTDFVYTLDASQFVHPQCMQIVTFDNAAGFDGAIREFTDSTNKLKSIYLRKHVVWDYKNLSAAIYAAVRSTGFRRSITISYPMGHHKISVKSSSALSRCYRHPGCRFVMCITCTWIIICPIAHCYGDKIDKIRSDFAMTISAQQWFEMNYHNIIAGVFRRI